MSTTQLDTIHKQVHVDLDPPAAFELFTAGIARWWPVGTHSYRGAEVTGVVFEARVGGRVYESTADGEQDWATVRTLDPPLGFVLDWLIGSARGSEVEVRFQPEGAGTRVTLEHRGLTDGAAHESYDDGWDAVLAPYTEAAR